MPNKTCKDCMNIPVVEHAVKKYGHLVNDPESLFLDEFANSILENSCDSENECAVLEEADYLRYISAMQATSSSHGNIDPSD